MSFVFTKRAVIAIVAILGLTFLGPSNSVLAAPEIPKNENVFSLQDGWGMFAPIKNDLSSSARLMIEGMGPETVGSETAPGGEFTNQAPGALGLVPYRSPAPAFSRNYLVTRDRGTPIQTEPHIAVNPNDPKHVVLTAIDYAVPYNSVYVSFDGGETWQGPVASPLNHGSSFTGDPVLAFDRNGTVFQASMDLDTKTHHIGPMLLTVPVSKITVAGSEDGGLEWGEAVVAGEAEFATQIEADKNGRMQGSVGLTFPDKPWLAIGPSPENPGEDVLYVTYTVFLIYYRIVYLGDIPFLQFTGLQSLIAEAHSEDEGTTWSKPKAVSPIINGFEKAKAFVEEIDLRIVQGSAPRVADDGKVFVAWYDSLEDGSEKGKGEIHLSWSEDAGENWSKPVVAADLNDVARRPRTALFRYNSSPQLALGPEKELYIAFVGGSEEKPNDDGDLYFVRSFDEGKTFSQPQRINQDETDNLQFFPAIDTDPEGNIHLMWGDARDDKGGLKYHIYYTRSFDRGETWGFELPEQNIREPATRVTDFPSNPNKGFPRGLFIGDYFGIAAANKDDVYMVWADTRLGEYGPFNQKIGFARREAIPSPELFLNPARGPGGQEVTLQAFNFQPDLNLFVRIGGNIVSAGRTTEDGRAEFRIFIPIAGEGAHDVVLYDDSGNVAVGSFYMDFGFGDLSEREIQSAVDSVESNVGLLSKILIAAVALFAVGTAIQIFLIVRAKRNK